MNELIKTVVIVGRLNVGKSTLFNCLIGSEEAVTSPHPGTTCDRKYGLVEHGGRIFKLVDTGGVDLGSLKDSILALASRKTKIEILSAFKGILERTMIRQTKAALKEADLLLVVVDAQQGLHPGDKDLAEVLKQSNTPKILVCNKVDKPSLLPRVEEFKKLRLGEPMPISALSGKGKDALFEMIIDTLDIGEGVPAPIEESPQYRLAMIGRSGVGKSMLFNKILGEELAVVSDVYQTTIDVNDGTLAHQGKFILLTDTPGLLMKKDRKTDLDEIAYQKTMDVLKKADAVLFVTEVKKSLCGVDRYLAYLVGKKKVPTVIVANKWDIFPRKDKEMVEQITIHYRDYLPDLNPTPIVFTSAKTGEGVKKILELIIK